MYAVLRRLILPFLLVLSYAATGCDETPAFPESGEFQGNVDGSVAGPLSGSAIQKDVDGIFLTVDDMNVAGCSTSFSVATLRPRDTLFTELEGVYGVTPDAASNENKRLVRVTVSIGPDPSGSACPGLFRGRSGEIRVERAGNDLLEGTLMFDASPPADGSAGAPTDTIRVTGEFQAARRSVEG